MRYVVLWSFIFSYFFCVGDLQAQKPSKPNAAELKQALNKLEVLGSAMYLAAHPDDENTNLIAFFANEKNYRTTYLSMTRGDGGQNLIGTDIREYLGIIRTQELLAARRTDGGEQSFTRANDFGYSKDPDETLNFWNKDKVLSDVIWAIRKYRPDIIITRFDTSRVAGGRMHGHHTASAILAQEAFDLAGNPQAFPEQLKYVEPWQPKSLYWNTYNFGGGFTSEHEDEPGYFSVNIGVYNPLLGKSYGEISALSRSQHKSQGFGSTGSRGDNNGYLMYWKGDMPQDDIFENINDSWSRIVGGEPIGQAIRKVNAEFDISNPAAIVPELMKIRKDIAGLGNEYRRNVKLKELDQIIKGALGLFLEVKANDFSAVKGEQVSLQWEAINRSAVSVILQGIQMEGKSLLNETKALSNNLDVRGSFDFQISEKEISQPYWLVNTHENIGMYQVNQQSLVGLPENPPALLATFKLKIAGEDFEYTSPVVYKENDRVEGEVYRPFVITPPVFVSLEEDILFFIDNEPKSVEVLVKAGMDNINGTVQLNLPQGWEASTNDIPYELIQKGDEFRYQLFITPPAYPSDDFLSVSTTLNGKVYDRGLRTIDYDHIPYQMIFSKTEVRLVKADLKIRGERVGYIMGSGDEIPSSLEQMGFRVDLLDPEKINQAMLSSYDAVVVGIRAFNTVERMSFVQPELMKYVQDGGNVIVQYNTSMRNQPPIGPYPFSISRDRVTDEYAEVRILAPDHPVMNVPNKITSKDFEGWVQERGLYFPDEWDSHYTPILSANDKGETPKNGGLLVTQYGRGYFVYTGYSWFRELPPGVPGAYRIFANMVSLGKGEVIDQKNAQDNK